MIGGCLCRPVLCVLRTHLSICLQAICSLIYAGERIATDLAEIAAVAKQLVGKYK